MEIISPKPEFIELMKLIVAQNDLIIHMNQSLIEVFSNPCISLAPPIIDKLSGFSKMHSG